jgi:signal transduction histidine kinase
MELWKRLSIRYKITSIIVLIILLITITIIPVISHLIKDALLKQQQNNLESVKNLVTKLFDDYQSKVMNYTKLFSNDREIKDTLFYHTELSGEREHPLRAVIRLHKSFDVSSIELGDSSGRVVAKAEDPGRYDENRSSDPLIKNALKGKVVAGIVLSEKGFVIKASVPVYYNENQIIGTITSGILLDSSLLSKIKQLSNTELIIMDNTDNIISSTLGTPQQKAGNYRPLINDAKSLVIKFPLSDVSGNAIGNVFILQEDRLPQIIAKSQLTLLILLSVISALSIFILFITLKRLMQPIVRLKEGAEKIGRGEFTHRIEVTSKDEIGELSEGFNTMAQNLGNLQKMEERLRQSERLAAVGKFAAGIAHEINNPIGNAVGVAKLMLKNVSDDNTKDDIETIIKNADRCARITKDLLTYSRQSPPRKEMTSVNILIDDAVNAVTHHINSGDIKINKELGTDLTDMYIDPLQISQVLNNILRNAVQSMDNSGSITIETLLSGDMVEIVITDTGYGIDEDIRGRIFDPFFTTKAVGEGTGLGLAISYGIIQNHGGEITVESKKGYGSIFKVRLPMGENNG